MKSKINFRELGILIVFVALMGILIIVSPTVFAKPSNLINILKQASINGVLATGMMFVILSDGIDLSVGSTVALSGVVATMFAHPNTYPIIVPIVLALVVGLLVGIFNGAFIAYGKIPPFIVTLGSMTIIRGLALIISGGAPVFGVSDTFEELASGSIGMFPYLAIYLIIVVIIAAFVLTKTVYGRRIYAIGGNEESARISGISVNKLRVSVYGIAGLLAGFAGLLLASRTISGSPTAGQSYELDAIAAVIIGGVSMSGGSGKWYGTIIGALLLAVLSNALDIFGVSSHFQLIIKGAIIIGAVFFDIRAKKRS